MILDSDLKKDWYKPGEIGKFLGVSSRTILNYRDSNIFKMRLDEKTNRWYASREEVIKLLKHKGVYYCESSPKVSVLYARVSSNDQKKNGDLNRQINKLVNYCLENGITSYEVYSDVGSGLNSNRQGLGKLLHSVMYGNVDNIYITYKDRLTRFGFEYLETLCNYFGVNIITIEDISPKSEQEELVDDMMSLLASFSGKLYGMKSNKKKKAKEYIDSIVEEEEVL